VHLVGFIIRIYLSHVCVLHFFGLQVSGGFAQRLLSYYANEGGRRGYASSRILEVD